MRKMLLFLIIIAIFTLYSCSSSNISQEETAAVDAAKAWLSLVDGERYAESWEESAPFFKSAVGKEQWIQTIQSVRKPFGKNISRELKEKRYRSHLPGAPDGEYVVIQFKASFINKNSAIETVTPMLDKDGKWRVSGYFMK